MLSFDLDERLAQQHEQTVLEEPEQERQMRATTDGPPRRRFLGLLVAAAALFALGNGTGVVAAARLDPLRQDSVAMETWYRANVTGDAETMWQQESANYHDRFTSGHDEYVQEYAHVPNPHPPTIRFVASVPLAGSERELFYDFDLGTHGHTVLAVYVDAKGRFDGPAI